jgi:predicted MPP superfamily phosphohydrolase
LKAKRYNEKEHAGGLRENMSENGRGIGMRMFLLVFFLAYGLMHLYVFFKARVAFPFGVKTGIPIALFMLVMVVAPVIVRLSERAGYEFIARFMSLTGYVWLGLLFLFISAALVFDFYRICLAVIKLLTGKSLSAVNPSAQFSFFIPLVLSLTISSYGYFEARNVRTERLIIKTPKLPKEIGTLKIVQISDVHLGLIVRSERLKLILDKVKSEGPDIFVSTGDLVDGQINNLTGLADMLHEIKPPYGKYAITGNHEFYAGIKQSTAFTQEAGFEMLRGKTLTNGIINIAGVDDPTALAFDRATLIKEKDLLSGLDHNKFTLFLKHRPFLDKDAQGLYDLQISGHTHKGQIFPFSIFTAMLYPADHGLLKLANNSSLYVSRGSGTWGPPIRFLSPPEVTVYEIIHGEGTKNTAEKETG